MEATAMALRQPLPCPSSYNSTTNSSSSKESRILRGSVYMGRIRPVRDILSSGFCDQGHLQYYSSKFGCYSSTGSMSVISGMQEKRTEDKPLKKMKKKQQLKLLKDLTRDLSTFSQIGFGLGLDSDQVKGNMISEAAETLLEKLQKIRAEEKELKKKKKEEKTIIKASRNLQMQNISSSSSSSSSSESSDSECGEIVDMNKLKQVNAAPVGSQQVMEDTSSTDPTPIIIPTVPTSEGKIGLLLGCSSSNVDTKMDCETCPIIPTCSKKIEVCMGGKCKKMGGVALLEELQRAVGIEGVVSGCKCMGKCRDGPNVKVVKGLEGGVVDDPVRAPANALCIGVGLEDVNMIVANFLGENQNQLGIAVAAAAT